MKRLAVVGVPLLFGIVFYGSLILISRYLAGPIGAYFWAIDRGHKHMREGKHDKAIVDFTEAIRLIPLGAEAFCRRGGAYYAIGEHDQAIVDFTEAIRLAKKTEEYFRGDDAFRFRVDIRSIYERRGDAYLAKGEHNQAIADYTEAIRLMPTVAGQFYQSRADAYSAMGDQDRAAADYAQAKNLGYSDYNRAPRSW